MNKKEYGYLFYKVQGLTKEEIIKAAEITEEEYYRFESNLAEEYQSIQDERKKQPNIGKDFVRLTYYIYDHKPDQANGIPCPKAVLPIEGHLNYLPKPSELKMPDMSLAKAIEIRRSLRKYSNKALNQEELAFLLWATQWVRQFRSGTNMELTIRNVPSAGCRHPFETYLLINKVEGIPQGIYYYHPIEHGLILFKEGEIWADALCQACLGQEMVKNSAVTFIWVAIPYRTSWRYSQRAYRYLYLDAGHVGQNLHLAAEAIGAGACMIGAFSDEAVNEVMSVNGIDAFVIYLASLGKR